MAKEAVVDDAALEVKEEKALTLDSTKTLFIKGLKNLIQIEKELKEIALERDELIHLSIIALMVKGNLVAIGEPGTAKSMTIELLTKRIIDPSSAEGLKLFNVLCSADTKSEEIFGPYDLNKLEKGEYSRKTDYYLPWAEIAFLDEIFNAPGYLQKTMLKILNERQYKNGDSPVWQNAPLISLFGATNQLPIEDHAGDLAALFDRFDFRLFIHRLSPDGFKKALDGKADNPKEASEKAQATETKMTIQELKAVQGWVERVKMPKHVRAGLAKLRFELESDGIFPTDRRFLKMVPPIMKAEAMLNNRDIVDDDDFQVLEKVLWTKEEDIAKVKKALVKIGNPMQVKLNELLNDGQSILKVFRQTVENKSIVDDVKNSTALESSKKLRATATSLNTLLTEAKNTGRPTTKIENAKEEIRKMMQEVNFFLTGESI